MANEVPVYDSSHVSEIRKENILVSRFASYYEPHKDLSQAHRHSFYHLLLFTQGNGSHSIDFEKFSVQPYQFYFTKVFKKHVGIAPEEFRNNTYYETINQKTKSKRLPVLRPGPLKMP